MRSKTKIKRANYVAKNILVEHIDKALPLQEWVTTINKRLGHSHLNNTKEAAKMFSYIINKFHKNIIRERVPVVAEQSSTITYYTFKGDINGNRSNMSNM